MWSWVFLSFYFFFLPHMCKPQPLSEPQRAAKRTDRVITMSLSPFSRFVLADWTTTTVNLHRKQKSFAFVVWALWNRVLISERFFDERSDGVFPHHSGHWHKTSVERTWMKNAISSSVCVLYSETSVSPNAFSWVATCECVACISMCVYIFLVRMHTDCFKCIYCSPVWVKKWKYGEAMY